MKKIFVRKIFPYDPTLNGKCSKYEGYCLICLRRGNPDISKDLKIQIPKRINKVYCSNLKRGIETAKSMSKEYKETSLLNEVLFDLSKLVTKEEFEKYGSDKVRLKFIEHFIQDRLLEKKSTIKSRILRLLSKLNKLPDGGYLLISHSFLMKILEVYIKTEGKLFASPRLLRKYFDYRKKTYNFGEGFEFNL